MADEPEVTTPVDYEAAFADSESREYYLPPEGQYKGTLATKKDGKKAIYADPKYGRVRFALKVTSKDEKNRWIWGDLKTQHPKDAKGLSPQGAATRVKIMSRTVAAFAVGLTNGNGAPVVTTFKDKGAWSTSDLTEYASEVMKMSVATVSFTVKHRTKGDKPDLDKNGNQRYNVYVNSGAAE